MIGREDYVTPKPGIVIKYNGTFNLDKLYKEAKNWFDDFNYRFTEKEYKEKQKAHGNEISMEFLSERNLDGYTKFRININFLMLSVKKLSKDTYTGNVRINIISYLEFDYKARWQYNPFKKFLFFVYNNLVIKNKIQSVYGPKLYNEVLKFEDLIKNNLGML